MDDGIELQIGRDELLLGPSQNLDIRASCSSISTIAEDIPWDMLKYSGKIKLNENQNHNNKEQLSFTRIFSIFDKKWLIGQRFEYSLNKKWRLGLSEATVINKYENSSLIYLNPIPIPLCHYFAGQFLEKEQITDKLKIDKNNYHNLGFDLSWFPEKNLELYIEMILYDLPVRAELNSFLHMDKYGLAIGGYFSDIFTNKGKDTDLRIEYNKTKLREEKTLFSASLIHDISKKCQIELSGTIKNSRNIDNQVNEKLQELALSIELQYRF